MKRIGILGGMSPESTALYYRLLVDGVASRLGGFHSPDILLHSVNFQTMRDFQEAGDWVGAGRFLADSAVSLERAGAEAILLATNTMHLCADAISGAVSVPLLHIADATAAALKSQGVAKTALFGTRATMEMAFYRDRLSDLHGIDVWTPDADGRARIHDIIFKELVKGVLRDDSRQVFIDLAQRAASDGARGAVLGCTEIGLLVGQDDLGLPTICSARAHVAAALDFMLD